jgi:hypothetical protein
LILKIKTIYVDIGKKPPSAKIIFKNFLQPLLKMIVLDPGIAIPVLVFDTGQPKLRRHGGEHDRLSGRGRVTRIRRCILTINPLSIGDEVSGTD